VGIDYGAGQARIAGSHAKVAAVVGDACTLPFRKDAFDLVVFADVLEHVLRPRELLAEAARVAAWVSCLVPLERGWIADPHYAYRRLRGKHTNLEQYGHIWRWGREQVLALLASSGLSVERVIVHAPPAREETGNPLGRALKRSANALAARWPKMGERLMGSYTLVCLARR
jgi:SAM-dependent methyltransferase